MLGMISSFLLCQIFGRNRYVALMYHNEFMLSVAVPTMTLHCAVTPGGVSGGRGEDKPKFGPNLNEFVRRFDAATTNGQGVY
jgi:hypothetical protein